MNLAGPSQGDLDRMSHVEKDALIVQLFDRLASLEGRLKELEGCVEKTSRNSSKPPSSDGLRKGAAEPRRRGENASGGQAGHPGKTLRMVEKPDVVVDVRPAGRCGCGLELLEQDASLKERRQQIDLPEPQVVVTEYRQWSVRCRCGQGHCESFPAEVTPNVSYGARLKAYAVGLIEGHFVGLERTSELLGDQYGVYPSDGTLQRWVMEASERLVGAYEATRSAVLNAEVAHFDESGMRVGGVLHWLHVAASPSAVHYTTHPHRGQEAMEEAGILPVFEGCALHDHWKSYWHYTDATHALCNAHHLRELLYFEESTGHWWPVAVRRLLLEGKEAVTRAHAEKRETLDPAFVADLFARYDEQVANGLALFPVQPPDPDDKRRTKQHPATNLLLRLRDYKTEVWRFLTDWRVPFDNNRAERAVRPVKVKLKIIGGFRSKAGAKAFCILRSVWETSRLNGRNPFEVLRTAFTA
jgi:transposase